MSDTECWWPECGGADDAPCPECPTPRLDQEPPDPDRLRALLMQERTHCTQCGRCFFGAAICPECGKSVSPFKPAVGVSP